MKEFFSRETLQWGRSQPTGDAGCDTFEIMSTPVVESEESGESDMSEEDDLLDLRVVVTKESSENVEYEMDLLGDQVMEAMAAVDEFWGLFTDIPGTLNRVEY